MVTHFIQEAIYSGCSSGRYFCPLYCLACIYYTHHLSAQIPNCDLFTYVDDTTLIKVIPSKDDRTAVAIEINANFESKVEM